MSTKKPARFKRLTSPAGIGKWVFINKPRAKYKKEAEFEYSLELTISKADYDALVAQLTPLAEQAKADAIEKAEKKKDKDAIAECKLHIPVGEVTDDDGKGTGEYTLRLKRDASYKTKEGNIHNVVIPIFDTDTPPKPLTNIQVGKGSTLKAAFDVVPFAMPATFRAGVSARLSAVQVIKLMAPGNDTNPTSYGFGGQDDGYVASETEGTNDFQGGGDVTAPPAAVPPANNPNF